MAFYFFHWTERAIEKVAEHGLTPQEVESVVENPESEDISRSTGRPIAVGETPGGTLIAVVYELDADGITAVPITAYEIED